LVKVVEIVTVQGPWASPSLTIVLQYHCNLRRRGACTSELWVRKQEGR